MIVIFSVVLDWYRVCDSRVKPTVSLKRLTMSQEEAGPFS